MGVWILLLGGLGVAAWGGFEMVRRWMALRWPQAHAEIRYARLEEMPAQGGVSFRLQLSYRYEVAGRSLLGNRVRFGAEESFDTLWEAESVLARYEPGRTVLVRYNPRRPEEAVLDVQETDGFAFAVAGGVAVALFASALLFA